MLESQGHLSHTLGTGTTARGTGTGTPLALSPFCSFPGTGTGGGGGVWNIFLVSCLLGDEVRTGHGKCSTSQLKSFVSHGMR